MKSWRRILPIIISIVLFLGGSGAIVGISVTYFDDVSGSTYKNSISHLMEVYGQVNNQFKSFIEKNFSFLDDCADGIQSIDADSDLKSYIEKRKNTWKFSDFFFLAKSENGVSAISSDGKKENFSMKKTRDALLKDGEKVLSAETLSDKTAVSVFAVPAEGVFDNNAYSAIAVCYTNELLSKILQVNAFSHQSSSFIVDTDGDVFLASNEGDSIFRNYLIYLKEASDIEENAIKNLSEEWKSGKSGVITCRIGVKEKESTYISYQSVEYQGFMLLSSVPVSKATANLMHIQSASIDMLVKIFAIIMVLVIAAVVYKFIQTKKRDKSELRYREMMFDTLNVRVNDIFLMLDAKTFKPDYLSPNVERLLGIPHKKAINDVGLLDGSAVDVGAFISREKISAIPISESRHLEREHVHQGTGERRWYLESIYHENIQGLEKYLVIISDRTSEREMNQRLEQALAMAKNANEAKSHFLSNMSHDIRTPMNAIIGLSALLSKDADKPEKVREYTRKISSSGQHLLSLINDVLDMSKIESGKTSLNVSEFSLPEMLDGLYTVLLPQSKAKRQEFEIYTEGCPSERLLGDKLRLNQILLNLLSNAIKYTGVGGRINLTVQSVPQESAQYAKIRFIVRDNGYGMSKEFLKTVFDPFTREVTPNTSGIQGTGLGMAITKNLVDLMGGVIEVESELDKGSAFTVDITFAVPDSEDEDDFWLRGGISRILVADDDEIIRNDVKATLNGFGVDVTCVSNGAEAVEATILAHKNKKDFNVVLLDWRMPVTDGVEAARQIHKKIKSDVPILVLYSYDLSDVEKEAREAGIDAFMTKPFFVSAFKHTIEAFAVKSGKFEPEQSSLDGMTFLAAEDNELNAEILAELLTMENARYELAKNGKEAFEMFKNSDPDKYDMILMDVQMPIMDGYRATEAIRACDHPRAKTIPIIAMTANAFADDVRNALNAGMTAHLAKPVDMNAVRTVIGKLKTGKDVKKEESD